MLLLITSSSESLFTLFSALEKPAISQPTVPQLPTLKRVEKPAATPQATSLPTSPQLPVLRKSTDSKPIKPEIKG